MKNNIYLGMPFSLWKHCKSYFFDMIAMYGLSLQYYAFVIPLTHPFLFWDFFPHEFHCLQKQKENKNKKL